MDDYPSRKVTRDRNLNVDSGTDRSGCERIPGVADFDDAWIYNVSVIRRY